MTRATAIPADPDTPGARAAPARLLPWRPGAFIGLNAAPLLALLLCLSVGTMLRAAEAISDFTLDNGLQVVVIEDHRAPVVTHMIWYRVGAADDPPGKSGLAHFLEHLMFNGTEQIPRGEFSAIIEDLGGEGNAFTSNDYTAYFQRIAARHLPLMMQMEADRMHNLVLDEAAVTREREVVLEERNGRVDSDPGGIFAEQRRAALFLNHPYGRPTIGWRHEIEGLTLDDTLDFYRRYYAPNNAILVVAGDVTPDQVRQLATEHFGSLPPSTSLPPRARPQEPPHQAERRLSYADPRVRQPYVVRSYLAPQRRPGTQEQAAALTLLADMLGGGQTSFLYQRLVLDEKVALGAGAFYGGQSLGPSSFGVYVVPAADVSLDEAEAALDDALAAFLDSEIDVARLERVRNLIDANQIFALDSQQGRARRYGAALSSGLTIADVQDWPRLLTNVAPEDIRAAAETVFERRNSVTAYLQGAEVAE